MSLIARYLEENGVPTVIMATARDIVDVDMELPPLSQELMDLTKWVARYYLCSWGEAARAALEEVAREMTVAEEEGRVVKKIALSEIDRFYLAVSNVAGPDGGAAVDQALLGLITGDTE